MLLTTQGLTTFYSHIQRKNGGKKTPQDMEFI